ncbi:type II 3-dehydroquinate dehydratase [Aquirhabdus parva]|uniref:3-dehydroquinate dehydratase n=1 Tax=Aquirhabdus parva TaxID=2283318 RepID=A0A345P5K8_9GAMM|nr:type II 3-dehydroquinate dehydratase [Aquirhabdus parva]AXI02567.1 type II 3-dehydroquinate dehydratase [Aquirhabdus parva]
MVDVLVLHGPNLNLLGQRETTLYGHTTLNDINASLAILAEKSSLQLESLQSNWEGALIDRIHLARTDGTRFIIINAGALTHTSIGIRDALLAAEKPFIEVHLSNVYARESFRHHSYLADKAVAVISGLGAAGYRAALEYAIAQLNL